MHVVYKIFSVLFPERIYIGSAVDMNKRRNSHFTKLDNNIHPNNKLQNHFNKYGDLMFSVIEEVEEPEKLVEREQYYIDTLNPHFNLCKIAWSQLGMKRSEESKQKMREKAKRKRKPLTPEHRENVRKAMLGKKRRPFTEEEKKRIGKAISEAKRKKNGIKTLL